ncbi:hypothetical protein BGX27_000362 [Mortierella sp. AM989]|nr:hypothetical protein BGX27_000362 [Mortierella sp. AM989]
MTFLSLKAVSALAFAFIAVQAVPLAAPSYLGDACNQHVNSGNVNVGSTTNITPITDVTPITRYQPIVQAYAPIVHSQCDRGFETAYKSNFGGSGYPDLGYSGSSNLGYSNLGYDGHDNYGQYRHLGDSYSRRRFLKRRDDQTESQQSEPGSLLFSQLQSNNCPAGQVGCETSVPQQNIDLGSHVNIQPSNQVFPSTTYQNQVQSLDADIQAAQAQSSSLPQQNVNLGSNVSIQPTTQVIPQTTYQPSVNQLTTSVQAAPQQDQSLPQSSVQLGSQVYIAPNVQVRPLTTFQPSITSLPFIINSGPCVSDISTLPSNSEFSSVSSSGVDQPFDSNMASSVSSSSQFSNSMSGRLANTRLSQTATGLNAEGCV